MLNLVHESVGAGKGFGQPTRPASSFDIVVSIIDKKDILWSAASMLLGDSIDLRVGLHALGFIGEDDRSEVIHHASIALFQDPFPMGLARIG